MIKRLINQKQRKTLKENKELKSKLEKLIELLLQKKIINKKDLKGIE